MTEKRILEVCCGDIDSVRAAEAGGAARVELCSGLSDGGMTPSAAFITEARRIAPGMKIHVLIRHREGDFVYTDEEIELMRADIAMMRSLGADGVVIGALTVDGDIDVDACRRILADADGLSVTFSRAFDLCREPEKALEDVIALGCDRLLTSGCEPSAEAGVEMLRTLKEQAAGRIILLAGAGVSPANARYICDKGNVSEIHASARASVESPMVYRTAKVSMGTPGSDEYSRKTTSADIVRRIVDSIN
ncbi:MAG: copper homeostasis protein CutC [Clostridium sp.]|nr:copper homeostasis protein CutC [Clostridium sp.]